MVYHVHLFVSVVYHLFVSLGYLLHLVVSPTDHMLNFSMSRSQYVIQVLSVHAVFLD